VPYERNSPKVSYDDIADGFFEEERKKLSSGARNDLPDSSFAYIESGGTKDASGRTTPRSLRHYPIHDAAHVRNALARIAQGKRFAPEAAPKVHAAASKFGITMHAPGKASKRGYDDFEPAIAERRYYKTLLEARAVGEDADGKPSHIIGYASSFGNLSRKLGGDFVERVMPTAFEAAQSEGWPDVVCRYNHKDDYLLGTTLGGTLQLMTDAIGLKYDVLVPEHRSDIMELVARGDVQYSSFAFRCIEDDWQESSFGYPMRSLHSLELVDVAPVQNPAYFDTTAKVGRSMDELEGAVRSLARFKDADPDEIRSMMEDGNLKKLFKKSKKNKKAADPVETEETRTDETVAETEEIRETEAQTETEEVREETAAETEETRTDETPAETEEAPKIDVAAEMRKLMARRYHEYEISE
jgi:uncharacterized protein